MVVIHVIALCSSINMLDIHVIALCSSINIIVVTPCILNELTRKMFVSPNNVHQPLCQDADIRVDETASHTCSDEHFMAFNAIHTPG
ncbi:hypothetical protein M8J77_022566 [Diaphorina citri]|nr:hypothetical protein M8J77_022566 [Diaphorina citri]